MGARDELLLLCTMPTVVGTWWLLSSLVTLGLRDCDKVARFATTNLCESLILLALAGMQFAVIQQFTSMLSFFALLLAAVFFAITQLIVLFLAGLKGSGVIFTVPIDLIIFGKVKANEKLKRHLQNWSI